MNDERLFARIAPLFDVGVLKDARVLMAGCGSGGPTTSTRFSARIDNPWFPLRPGTVYRYRGMKDGQPSREVLTVTHQTKTIQGVRCTVVRDLLYTRGRLHERTSDWYAQDAAGNVWYYGEATAELDAAGKVTSTEGSWQAGVSQSTFQPFEVFGAAKRRPLFEVCDARRGIKLQ